MQLTFAPIQTWMQDKTNQKKKFQTLSFLSSSSFATSNDVFLWNDALWMWEHASTLTLIYTLLMWCQQTILGTLITQTDLLYVPQNLPATYKN